MAAISTRRMHISPASAFALALSLLAVVITGWINARVFEGIPHLEDEMAYVWQAQAIAGRHIKLISPPCPTCFLVPFVVDYQGYRFGKYPLAWPVLLAAGIRLGLRQWVNPFLAGLGVWLTYRLGQKLFNQRIGLLAALLTLTSPFFLINSSSLLSHPWSLVLSVTLALAWLDTFCFPQRPRSVPPLLTAILAGLCLGLQVHTRPLTAIGVGLPFFIHGLILLWRGSPAIRRRVLLVGAIALGVAFLIFPVRYALTGNPLTDPYTLWWPYDRIGFGPGIGVLPGGHSLAQAWDNMMWSLLIGESDLFGWGRLSWLFLPFGLWAIRRATGKLTSASWLVVGVFPSILLVYMLYWIGAWVLGPRYYYESLFSLTILTAAGIDRLIGDYGVIAGTNLLRSLKTNLVRLARPIAGLTLVILLVCANLLYYLPLRLSNLHGWSGVEKSHLLPFQTPQAQSFAPALVIVHPQKSWIEYGTLLDLMTANLDSPFILTIDQGHLLNQKVIAAFPDRKIVHYFTAEPYTFYTGVDAR